MPTFEFDLTEEAIAYTKESIEDMPGNPGQEVLVENLEYDGYCLLEVNIRGPIVETNTDWDLELRSNHPEAIEIIIETAKENFEDFARRLEGRSLFSLIGTLRQKYINKAFSQL